MIVNRRFLRTSWTLLCLVLGASVISACSNSKTEPTSDKPVFDAKNKDLQVNQRTIALEQTWAAAQEDKARLPAARESMKEILWKGGAPVKLRERALELLLTDESPEGLADTRNMLRLRLPTEGQWPMVVDICAAVEKRVSQPGWKEMTAALVRSYARKVPSPPDADRPERSALLALHSGVDLNRIAYEVFVLPLDNGAPKKPDDYAEKSRQAAWDLLGRLDPDGSQRTAMIAADTRGEPVLKELGRSARELGVVPITGSELSWIRTIINSKDAKSALWWTQTTQAVAALTPEQKAGLAMRHLEPVRWAAQNKPEWSSASRESLHADLASRLDPRKAWRKADTGEGGEMGKETLNDWNEKLVWGDLLAMLVIDDALKDKAIIVELYKQVDADRADESTEYGGVLWARDQAPSLAVSGKDVNAGIGEKFVVRGFPPRPAQRINDRTFVANDEMFQHSARSLAHYHFHVQTKHNVDYAGPGRGDLEYADTHGRNCLVFTSVQSDILDVDYYQRGGATVDLGEMRQP